MESVLTGLLAIAIGVGGIVALFHGLNVAANSLPSWLGNRLRPYFFILPAMLAVGVFLLYPAARTVFESFRRAQVQQGVREEFFTLDNYRYLLTDDGLASAMWNNLIWLLIVPIGAVAVGLAVAVLADRLRRRGENVAKSLIFMPMAVSFVGASTVWGFVYAWRPEGQDQIGLLSEVARVLGMFPTEQTWLQNQAINDFLLMVIVIWLQAGFAMVLLSAAIKAVPEDTIEAARIDGATEMQTFWRVVVPQIKSTIVVVLTTILILVLKVFDVVRVLTSGNFNTNVVANEYYDQAFTFGDRGKASVIVVALMVATIPFMIVNVRRFREQEATS